MSSQNCYHKTPVRPVTTTQASKVKAHSNFQRNGWTDGGQTDRETDRQVNNHMSFFGSIKMDPWQRITQ